MYRICYIIFFLFLSKTFAQTSETPTPFQSPDKQFGYRDNTQKVIIQPQFEQALPFQGEYAFVQKDKQWGLITTKGKWLIPAVYEDLGWTSGKNLPQNMAEEVTGYKRDGKWGLLSIRNKPLTQPLFDFLEYLGNDKVKAGKVSAGPTNDTLFGVLDIKGKEIIPIGYHYLSTTVEPSIFKIGYNKIYQENRTLKSYGLINTSNQIVFPAIYKSIEQQEDGSFKIVSFPSWKIVSQTGDTLASHLVDSLYPISENMYAFVSENKKGLIGGKDDVLKANMEYIFPQSQGFSIFSSDKKYGLLMIDSRGVAVPFLEAVYDTLIIENAQLIRAGKKGISSWSWQLIPKSASGEEKNNSVSYQFIDTPIQKDLLTRIKRNNKYGFINYKGEEVISAQYDTASNFLDSICVASYQGKYGLLKKDGSWYIVPNADGYQVNKYGFLIQKQKNVWYVINPQQQKKHTSTIPLSFMPDGSIQISQNGKVGRLTATGFACVPPKYDSISAMTDENCFWAYEGKNIFLYKSSGEILIQQKNSIQALQYIQNNYSPVKTGGRYGFVDGLGRLRISNRYDAVLPFTEGLAAVKFAGKWGFISKQDKIIIQPYYDEVSQFKDGFSIARKGKKYGLLDKNGKPTADFVYDQIMRHPNGVFITVSGKKYGLLGKNGAEVIYVKYDKIFPQLDGNIIAVTGNNYGLLNAKGITVFPFVYSSILSNPYSGNFLLCKTEKTISYTFPALKSSDKRIK